jgi:cytochrome c-type biogenesis protein CcmH/NrfG
MTISNHLARSGSRLLALAVGTALFCTAALAAAAQGGAATPAVKVTPVRAADMAQSGAAGGLQELLLSLEARVAANPRDVGQRMLLARTYAQLGQRGKGLDAMRALHRDMPKDAEVTVLLAATLSEGTNESELREAYRTFDEAVTLKPEVAPMARLYQGEVLAKLGDSKGAVKLWKDHLRSLPAGDQRRALFEHRIAAAK